MTRYEDFDQVTVGTLIDKSSGTQYDVDSLAGSGTSATALTELSDVTVGTLANQPTAGTAGNWYFTTDQNGVWYDNGTTWEVVAQHPTNITASDVGAIPDQADAVTNSHVATSAIGTDEIATNSISSSEIQDYGVTTQNIDGSTGTGGQVLTTEGTAGGVSWADPPSASTTRHDLRDYGADATGGTTSDAALDDAIAAADPHDVILFQDGTYQLTGDRVVSKPLTIKGENAEITRPTTNALPAIRFSGGGTTGVSSGLSANVTAGDSVIPVGDASLFAAGDDVMITDGTATRDADTIFDFASVISTDTTNNTLTIDTPVTFDYPNSTDGAGKVAIVDFMESPRFIDLECNGNGDTASWFLIDWAKNPLYKNVHITHHLEEGMYAFTCWRPTWRDCSVRWANDRTSGNGEAFKASKCQGARFINPYVSECRRGVDLVRHSHDNYVENPIIKKFTIGGVITHGSPAENTTVVGGTLTGDSTVTGGTAIYNQNNDHWSVRGTHIIASGEGIASNGNLTATGVEIEPASADAEYAISIVDSDDTRIQGRIRDPNGWFSGPNSCAVNIYALNNDVRNVYLDLDMELTGSTGIRALSDTGNVIENLRLDGRIDRLGGSNYGFRLDGSLRDFESRMDILNGSNNAYLFYNGETIEGLRLQDARAVSTNSPAVFIGQNHTATNKIWITNCDLEGSYALRLLRTDAQDVSIWGNRMVGTVEMNSTQNSVTYEQGDGSNLDADHVDGFDVYVQSTAPTTSDPYIRFEP